MIENILFFLILQKLNDWEFFWYFDKKDIIVFLSRCFEYCKEEFICILFKLVDFYMNICVNVVGCKKFIIDMLILKILFDYINVFYEIGVL